MTTEIEGGPLIRAVTWGCSGGRLASSEQATSEQNHPSKRNFLMEKLGVKREKLNELTG